MNTSHEFFWTVLAVSIALIVTFGDGCEQSASTTCRHADECPAGQFCRLGVCEPKYGGNGSADTAGGRTNAGGSESGGGSRPPADSPVDATGETTSGKTPTCPEGSPPAPGDLALNEILPNVPSDARGDANGDGTRDPFDDEFVEIVNRAEETLDLAGVQLVEGGDSVTTLQSVCLGPSEGLVVFGGISSGASPVSPEGVTARVSSTRFGFANSGGTFAVVGPGGQELASFQWGTAPSVSYTLAPQIDGSEFVSHPDLSDGSPMSPGRCPGGAALSTGCPNATPEPDAGDTGTDL